MKIVKWDIWMEWWFDDNNMIKGKFVVNNYIVFKFLVDEIMNFYFVVLMM